MSSWDQLHLMALRFRSRELYCLWFSWWFLVVRLRILIWQKATSSVVHWWCWFGFLDTFLWRSWGSHRTNLFLYRACVEDVRWLSRLRDRLRVWGFLRIVFWWACVPVQWVTWLEALSSVQAYRYILHHTYHRARSLLRDRCHRILPLWRGEILDEARIMREMRWRGEAREWRINN